MLTLVLIAVGALAVLAAWRLVAAGVVSVWSAMGTVSGVAGLVALLTGEASLSPRLAWWWASIVGVLCGGALYAATAAFVIVVRRWPVFDRHVAEIYDQRKGLGLGAALLLAAGISSPGEELFWRGLVQARTASLLASSVLGGVLTWVAYVAVNAASQSLAIIAGAVVSGAVWGGLALWTGGVLASLLCHAVWTALMLSWPPGGARRRHRVAADRTRR